MNSRRQTVFDTHPDGARLRQVELELRRLGERGSAAGLLAYVRETARGWLCTAEPEVRSIAKELIHECITMIVTHQANDLWRICQRELG